MAAYPRHTGPFKTYVQIARHLTHEGRLELPPPSQCPRCDTDCGFTKDGHYFRDFVFVDGIARHIAVQRHECGRTPNATFTALAAFQEPGAHYTVDIRGAVLDRVFIDGDSERAACVALRRTTGGRMLAHSTVARWCASFGRRAPEHAAVLRAHLSERMPSRPLPATGDPGGVIRLARAGFRLHRRWPRARFWEWFHEVLWGHARRHVLSPASTRARRDRRPHVLVIPVGPSARLPSAPSKRKEGPRERTGPQGAGGALLVPHPRAPAGRGP